MKTWSKLYTIVNLAVFSNPSQLQYELLFDKNSLQPSKIILANSTDNFAFLVLKLRSFAVSCSILSKS